MLQTLSRNRRLDALSGSKVSADNLAEAYEVLLKYCVRGMEGLAELSAPKREAKLRSV